MKYLVIKQYNELPIGTVLEQTGDKNSYSDNHNVYIPSETVEKDDEHFVLMPDPERKPLTAESFFGA